MNAQHAVPNSSRIQSVDFLRGLVMVLMVIDHVRVFSGLPAGGPEPGIFFTRWVTHFCAPVFVFLAGTSAYLYGVKLGDHGKLSRYLVSRGLILIVADLTIMRFSWTFNFDYGNFVLTNILWTIGWSMVILAGLLRLKPLTLGVIGLAIIFFQSLFGLVPSLLPEALSNVWSFVYSTQFGGPWGITILYVIVPWVGVMLTGYAFGSLLLFDEPARRKWLLIIGGTSLALFLLWGSINALSGSSDGAPFIFKLLAQRKYPASPLFLLMTIGPAILAIPFLGKLTSRLSQAVITIGKVPFFFYILHIPLIHLSAFVVQLFLYGEIKPGLYDTAPFIDVAPEYQWSLGMLYLLFVIDTVILYFVCRWYVGYKFRNPQLTWLKYL